MAAIVAALVVPVGFALSLEPTVRVAIAPHPLVSHVAVAGRLLPIHGGAPAVPSLDPGSEGATLFAVGTLLIAAAALMRRAG
jgi:hypothetical protein